MAKILMDYTWAKRAKSCTVWYILCFCVTLVCLSGCIPASVSSQYGNGRAVCESRDGVKCRGNTSCSATLTSCTACSTIDGELRCETFPRASGDVVFPEKYFRGPDVQSSRQNQTEERGS